MSLALKHTPTRADFAALSRLAGPLVLIHVGTMLMGVVDTIMVGRVSAAALAAVALGNMYFFAISIFGMGVLFALDPIIAQALGARDELAVRRGLQRGLVLSLVLTVPITLALLTVRPVLELVNQPADVIPNAAGYVYRNALSVWPFYVFVVLRQTLQAHHRVLPIGLTIVAANVVNVVLNYAWIYGNFGFPAMGVIGSAWATTASRWLMALMLLALGWSTLKRYFAERAPNLLDVQPLWRMLRLGLPIGAQMMLEGGAFNIMALLMGWLGVVQVAAHQIALNLASLTFMVPLGVSSAAAVIVGHAVGRGDPEGVRRSTVASLAVGAGFMLFTGVLFIAAPELLARLYTPEMVVIALAALLLPIAGVFQVFDGLQVVAIGLLRGLGDTRTPMVVNVVGFWCIGMPVSLWLGFGLGYGAQGLWWGLVVGLVVVAVFLIVRVRQREHHGLERIIIDEHAKALRAEPVVD
ncbi:MAG TPA: MATE family efflux transporter [Gammaproteobacteria bacterium]